MQHDHHMHRYIENLFDSIYRALNVDNINGISDWYACGDELV